MLRRPQSCDIAGAQRTMSRRYINPPVEVEVFFSASASQHASRTQIDRARAVFRHGGAPFLFVEFAHLCSRIYDVDASSRYASVGRVRHRELGERLGPRPQGRGLYTWQ